MARNIAAKWGFRLVDAMAGKLKRNLQAAHNFGAGGFNVRELEMTMVPLKSVGATVVREHANCALVRELCAST